jgi:hypothetical protein
MAYRPVPIPPDFSAPDLTIGQAMAFLQLSARSVQRLCALGHLDSFVLAGSRRIVFDSVKAYRQACIDRGPNAVAATHDRQASARSTQAPR